ncbi:phosphoserine phosphatase SerB [Pseudolactococcus plantarum]|uniref:phosphoserine phosphatase n=1 Tax=Pseudolactococcus plantarum TaxID=1365 RepID=A0A2A5RW23_9LACT|nr:phosphoserine phosphatase SerB [Lactococcus plantarum]PCS05394.1 phosphoserine phosphatase [Lactococcus plantarum]HCN75548.1 phosphoserine phosphatase SerB [Lactococcus sp.]
MTDTTGLLIMDVDSTLIQEEGIDLLGELTGSGAEVANITHRAMNGELDFTEALAARVALLAGLPDTVFATIRKQIHFTHGVRELVDTLHARGWKVGVVSGGFHETVDELADELGLDFVKANHLEVADGKLTGKVVGEVVTKEVKLASLKKWATELGLELSQTVAVGDGANDLPMILASGIGIAFNAKAVVREQAPYQINTPNLALALDIIKEVRGDV